MLAKKKLRICIWTAEALKRQFHERFRANRPYEDYPPEYGDDEEESNKGKKKKEEHDEYDEYDD